MELVIGAVHSTVVVSREAIELRFWEARVEIERFVIVFDPVFADDELRLVAPELGIAVVVVGCPKVVYEPLDPSGLDATGVFGLDAFAESVVLAVLELDIHLFCEKSESVELGIVGQL